jgi:catalase
MKTKQPKPPGARSFQVLATRLTTTLTPAVIAIAAWMSSSTHAQTPAALAQPTTAPATVLDLVNALKTNAGNPPQTRASFAKGQCVRGTYTPSAQAAQVTRSPSFTRPSDVLGRFSVGGGNPKVADTNRAVLRGFAFKLGTGNQSSDLLVENAPVHFAKSMDQMLEFLKARTPGADGKPDADKLKAFSAANPETLNQAHFVAAKPLPGSLAGVTYWGVHSFPAVNAKGERRFIKFKIVPVNGEVTLSDEEAKAKPTDFLVQDLEQRMAQGSVRFDVLALLGRPGDPTMDATVRWPDEDSRESVRLGTIAITAIENNMPCDATIFNPSNLAEGVGLPPDEMFRARLTAYAISLSKRQ